MKKKIALWRKDWKEMKVWNAEEINKVDWIVSTVILLFLFVTCMQGDLRLTGNRSFLMYSHPFDFYKASYEQSQGYYANYLPSTFIAYAIWNLPLYLVGHVPEAILTNSFINNMWFKLLPVILYYCTGHLIYKIGLEANFGEKKARLAKFAFLIFPIGVYSQFIFAQYDIFTVFLMVLGLYFYMTGKLWRFAFAFGFAATFKYHAILYFLALLVLREKRLRNLIKLGIAGMLPLAIEILPNYSDPYFQKNVFGFSALSFVQERFDFGFFTGINVVAAAAAFFLVWAYQHRCRDLEDLFSWGTFFCVGISFSVFGFAYWNPQWLLMLVPFLVLNIMINENGNMLVMVTNIFMLAIYIFFSQTVVNENVANGGILKYILPDDSGFAVRMWDIYSYHNEEMLLSAIWVILLVYVIFGHPKYHSRKGTTISKGLMWQLRSAFLFGVAAFMIPLLMCVAGALQGKNVFFDTANTVSVDTGNVTYVDENSSIEQTFVADGYQLDQLKIRVCTNEEHIEDILTVRIIDAENGDVLYEEQLDTYKFSNNSGLYSFLSHSVEVTPGNLYTLQISGEAEDGEGLGFFCTNVSDTSDSEELLTEVETAAGDSSEAEGDSEAGETDADATDSDEMASDTTDADATDSDETEEASRQLLMRITGRRTLE